MAQHFSVVAGTIPLNYHVTGVDEDQVGDFQADSALFRMDGPIAYQSAGGEEWFKVEILILLTDIVQLTNDNAYDIYKWAGAFQASMLNDALQIFKYGSGAGDDQSLIGCLVPDPDLKNNVRVFSYGQIDKDLRVLQVSVNGRFALYCQ
ncbi:MAG: hypothetical protein MN733_12220 [Nitrososphaera sp.]|nr:hypothetical protein [Nitrososphaera sp.]